jgi:RNA polymerase sigma-70 factor (ECF subfamily)
MSEKHDREAPLQNAASKSTAAAPELEQIFREHHRQVLRTAYRVTGNATDAEDVLQTVFMRLSRREGGSPLSDSPGNYLHRAAVNAALDIVRSRTAARTSPFESHEPMLTTDRVEGPEGRQEAGELKEQIKKALAKASPKSAEIFILRYFEGYGNHEIAKMLGTSRSTVNVILHRTRQRIKDDIQEYLGGRS